MTKKNLKQPWMTSQEIKEIFDALGKENTRFVGGCIRNALIGKEITDIDIATSLVPEETIKRLKTSKIRVIPTGLKHGTVTAILNRKNFEITTLRKDVECDGRHAKVAFTDDWKEDAARRDFTINAMSCSLDGKIFDYFGGLEDLDKRLIKFVGDAEQRCKEDYLRILRFFRFFAYYGHMPMDKESLKACQSQAGNISGLSGERIQAEMLKLFLADNLLEAISVMHTKHILQYALPIENLNFDRLEKLIIAEEENKIKPNNIRRLAALIKTDGLTKNQTENLSDKWKLSNKDKKLLQNLSLSKIEISPDSQEIDNKKLIRKLGSDIFTDLILIGWNKNYNTQYKAILKLAKEWKPPVFPVNGGDMQKLGVPSGEKLGKMLKKADKWWEDNNFIPDKEAIINYIKTLI